MCLVYTGLPILGCLPYPFRLPFPQTALGVFVVL